MENNNLDIIKQKLIDFGFVYNGTYDNLDSCGNFYSSHIFELHDNFISINYASITPDPIMWIAEVIPIKQIIEITGRFERPCASLNVNSSVSFTSFIINPENIMVATMTSIKEYADKK